MMISRAIVNKMNPDGTCSIKIPAQSDSIVDAFICVQKGSSVYYDEGETVLAAWLGEHDWVILGVEYRADKTEKIDTINVTHLNSVDGVIGDSTWLGNTGLRVRDLYDMRLSLTNTLLNINKGNSQ